MSRWYVCIDHLSEEQLEFFGWYRIRENGEFVVYAQGVYGENEQIVQKKKKFLLIDDLNDAEQMGDYLIQAPGKKVSN